MKRLYIVYLNNDNQPEALDTTGLTRLTLEKKYPMLVPLNYLGVLADNEEDAVNKFLDEINQDGKSFEKYVRPEILKELETITKYSLGER